MRGNHVGTASGSGVSGSRVLGSTGGYGGGDGVDFRVGNLETEVRRLWTAVIGVSVVALGGFFGALYWADSKFARVEDRFVSVEKALDGRFSRVEDKFDQVDAKFDTVNQGLTQISSNIAEMSESQRWLVSLLRDNAPPEK
jgi:uncharacterized protein YdcH (DUF465 family)